MSRLLSRDPCCARQRQGGSRLLRAMAAGDKCSASLCRPIDPGSSVAALPPSGMTWRAPSAMWQAPGAFFPAVVHQFPYEEVGERAASYTPAAPAPRKGIPDGLQACRFKILQG